MKRMKTIVLTVLSCMVFFACQKNLDSAPLKAKEDPAIRHWGLIGGVVSGGNEEISLVQERDSVWSITYPLAKGDMRFRGNHCDTVMYGHNISDRPGILSSGGESITIDKAGNYTIRVALTESGNYIYMLDKLSFP